MIITVLIITVIRVTGQTTMPDELLKSPLNEQMNYLDQHTKIYENFRAIREDMFQKLKGNIKDTLSSVRSKIDLLNKTKKSLNQTIDSMKSDLSSTKTSLDEMTKTKNDIKVLGIQVNKPAYNKVMWTIVAGLVAALVLGFFAFKRNLFSQSSVRSE